MQAWPLSCPWYASLSFPHAAMATAPGDICRPRIPRRTRHFPRRPRRRPSIWGDSVVLAWSSTYATARTASSSSAIGSAFTGMISTSGTGVIFMSKSSDFSSAAHHIYAQVIDCLRHETWLGNLNCRHIAIAQVTYSVRLNCYKRCFWRKSYALPCAMPAKPSKICLQA